MPHFYNPNQPRILKGHEGGGQWTDEDVHLARQPAPPPRPAPAHPRVMLPSPRILPPPGPAAPPSFESTGPLPFSFEALEPPLRAAADMYERLSARDTAEKRAVATFRARGFFFGDPTGVQVSVLNVDEVKAVCKKFDDVQSKLDQAD